MIKGVLLSLLATVTTVRTMKLASAAATVAALTVLGACASGDDTATDTAPPGSATTAATQLTTATTTIKPTTTTAKPTTTPPPLPPLDEATVAWWQANPDLNDIACSVGFDTVIRNGGPALDPESFGRLCAGEPVPAATLLPQAEPPLTIEELDAIIAPRAAAWMSSPSPQTFDELAAAASGVRSGERPPPTSAAPPLPLGDVRRILYSLTTYPGDDLSVVRVLDRLRPVAPSIPPVLRDGSFRVGVDVPPGTYRTVVPVEGCYWETLDPAGEINDNNFVTAPQVIMTIRSNDFAVNVEDCGVWVRT